MSPHASAQHVQDPVARMISALRMWRYFRCETSFNPRKNGECSEPQMDDWLQMMLDDIERTPESLCFFGNVTVRAVHVLLAESSNIKELTGAEMELQRHPQRAQVQGPAQDWMDCVCSNKESSAFPWKQLYRAGTGPRNINTYHHMMSSVVAPQLAWWLAFFPPERFLILTSGQLHDPTLAREVRLCCWQLQVLSRSLHLWVHSRQAVYRIHVPASDPRHPQALSKDA